MKNTAFNSSRKCVTEERRARGKEKEKKKPREVETTPHTPQSCLVFLYSDIGGHVTQSLTRFVCGDLVTWYRGCHKRGLQDTAIFLTPHIHWEREREKLHKNPAQPIPSLVPHQWNYYLHNAVFKSYMKDPYILRRMALNLFTSERWRDSKILTME